MRTLSAKVLQEHCGICLLPKLTGELVEKEDYLLFVSLFLLSSKSYIYIGMCILHGILNLDKGILTWNLDLPFYFPSVYPMGWQWAAIPMERDYELQMIIYGKLQVKSLGTQTVHTQRRSKKSHHIPRTGPTTPIHQTGLHQTGQDPPTPILAWGFHTQISVGSFTDPWRLPHWWVCDNSWASTRIQVSGRQSRSFTRRGPWVGLVLWC